MEGSSIVVKEVEKDNTFVGAPSGLGLVYNQNYFIKKMGVLNDKQAPEGFASVFAVGFNQ